MNQTGVVFIGIKGRVLAIDRATGQEVWRTPLKGGDFVNVVIEDGELYAATKGELFRLDPATGAILWQNGLQGLGRDLITIASSGARGAAVIREKRRRDEAATAIGAAAAAGA
jgi:outer membrane protein assembly factor BamB